MEKVSLLLDGELTEADAAAMNAHVAACQVCGQAYADFMLLRKETKAHEVQLRPFASERALRDIIATRNPPLWKKRIAIPVPVMLVFLIALAVVGLWSWMRVSRMTAVQEGDTKRIATESRSPDVFDLSRFDHGDRATIQKIKRASSVSQ
jgi:anti-sigma factor RsiW